MKTKKKGFTLIELMVSVSIFAIVALIVSTAFITMSYSYKRAQAMKIVIDNLNFAMDTMVLDLKNGKLYESCDSGDGGCIKFINLNNSSALYYLEEEKLILESGSNISTLTSPNITIDILSFTLDGGDPTDNQKVQINIKGSAESSFGDRTDFGLQTVVAKRNTQQ